jgi:hypothetical protein
MADYKATLNLPHTEFPMRGNLPQREPATLARWQKLDIYARLRAEREWKQEHGWVRCTLCRRVFRGDTCPHCGGKAELC